MTYRPHILLVDDERSIREPLASYLEREGYRVTQAVDALEGRTHLAAYEIELVVLDVMMPGEDGFSLCRYIRAIGETPVIMLTARTDDTDRIVGLEMGADDYLIKPFNPRELVARIKAVLRRVGSGPRRVRAPETSSFSFGEWVLKAGQRVLIDPDGVSVPLSTGEYNLLLTFLTHPRQVLTRDHLMDLTRGREAAAFDRSIDNQVSRLRRKIESDVKDPVFIKTVWGGGYTLAADVKRL